MAFDETKSWKPQKNDPPRFLPIHEYYKNQPFMDRYMINDNSYMNVSENGGTQQPWVFLLKMIILGCEMGVPPFTETPLYK